MLEDVVRWIDDYAGALLVLATLALAYVTWRLARESSIARLSAVLAMTASVWEGNETAAVFRLRNYGQAAATGIVVTFRWFDHGQPMAGMAEHMVKLPVLAPGEARSYMPDTLIAQVDRERVLGIDSMAQAGWSVQVAWSWKDQRTRVLGFGAATHTDSLHVDFAAFKTAVHGPPNIIDPYSQVSGVIVPGVPGRIPRERSR